MGLYVVRALCYCCLEIVIVRGSSRTGGLFMFGTIFKVGADSPNSVATGWTSRLPSRLSQTSLTQTCSFSCCLSKLSKVSYLSLDCFRGSNSGIAVVATCQIIIMG